MEQTPRQSLALGSLLVVALVATGVGGLVVVLRTPSEAPADALRVPLAATTPAPWDVGPWERVCARFVDDRGLVDYRGLLRDPADLQAFLQEVTEVSPHTNLATFPSEPAALAYWLNAHNAWMLRAVLDAYPVASVQDLTQNTNVFGVAERVCGGESLSLQGIKDDIVRGEFRDPRVHFALNYATLSSPRLPREAFRAESLDRQLDRAAARFLQDPANLRVDSRQRVIYLSPIFDHYSEDFLRWLREGQGLPQPTVLDYVRRYAPPQVAAQLREDYRVEYLPYDWRLNDQNSASSGRR